LIGLGYRRADRGANRSALDCSKSINREHVALTIKEENWPQPIDCGQLRLGNEWSDHAGLQLAGNFMLQYDDETPTASGGPVLGSNGADIKLADQNRR
jgi:hypothetical protein